MLELLIVGSAVHVFDNVGSISPHGPQYPCMAWYVEGISMFMAISTSSRCLVCCMYGVCAVVQSIGSTYTCTFTFTYTYRKDMQYGGEGFNHNADKDWTD